MSASDLKENSQTDWDKISKMTDKEIDTSDIPPLDEAFFANAKLRLPSSGIKANRVPTPKTGTPSLEFSPGQIVVLKSDPSVKGAVVETVPGEPENRFKVFAAGSVRTYYASQLQAEDNRGDDTQLLPCEQFHVSLTAQQIQHPSLSTLYSLNAARVDFIPYQFRPVLRFIRSDRPRLLIADGVGVGKTIEAGLILRELQARREINSVLIICPRPLVTERKWELEMKRFDERFTHLDGKELRYCLNEMHAEGEWPDRHRKTILPYSLFDERLLYGPGGNGKRRKKSRKGLLDLDPPPRFDLVIVDEAHHIRNLNTHRHEAVQFFCEHAEAAVFLTATPIQLGRHDLFVLLNTLRPDLILDQESFKHMAEPNPFINQAVNHARTQGQGWTVQASEALDQAAATDWGQAILSHNPEFKRIKANLASGSVAAEERVQFITDLENLHTFSGIINRTRRRDIGAFTVRKPKTVPVDFTPDQKQIHDDSIRVLIEIFSLLYPNIPVPRILKFMLQMIRRQAASCLHGLAPFLEDILNRRIPELEELTLDEVDDIDLLKAINSIRSQIQTILEKARKLDPYDPKLEALRTVIQDKQKLPNNKIMLFSTFRYTLSYLYKHLFPVGKGDIRVGMVRGDTPDEDRVALRNRFEKPREDREALDILLFSEVGCEGLDYQFCDCIVNYDLPWNPMRVEQRIGRIDRNGQQSESVAIVNLVTPGTVDADIYERCLFRIGVFENALGGNEEILGDIASEIKNIAEDYTLSEEDRRAKLQQLADNKIRLVQEQERLEQQQLELFGLRLPEDQMKKEVEEATSFWLSSASLRRLVTLYLQNTCGKEQEFILGEKPLKTLRLSQEARNSLLRDFQQLPRQNTPPYREWETWLKESNPLLSITFESACASQNPKAAFIMPLHPLVKQAAMSLEAEPRASTILKVRTNEVLEGHYEFVIYQWRFHGIREDLVLKPIASAKELTPHLSRLLEKAEDADSSVDIATPVWDALDAQHHALWSEARTQHQQHTQELVAYRKESLSTSHRARLELLQDQLDRTDNESLQRMRRSQIETAEADYERRVQELDGAMERADIIAEPVAYGVLTIEGM